MPKAMKISSTPMLAEPRRPSAPMSLSKSSEPVSTKWKITPARRMTPDPTWMMRYRIPALAARFVRPAQTRKTEVTAVSSQ